MGRAKRGLYAGRHIQYGNRVSEDGQEDVGNRTSRRSDCSATYSTATLKSKSQRTVEQRYAELGQMEVAFVRKLEESRMEIKAEKRRVRKKLLSKLEGWNHTKMIMGG
ncbi:hypothetical protein HID58_057262 [Brassica napus]|uniref:Uncharacterized protein n=1 Tax=Brassica napus TaxID=3708 RepID=A0ABQ8ARJ6_BRANA|nr:hypothetical protein HID58_057262 [Brassica napus]